MDMHHIDELLTWLAYLVVRDLNVQVRPNPFKSYTLRAGRGQASPLHVQNAGIQPLPSTHVQHQRFLPVLTELIPHRMRDSEAMRARSPFTSDATIPEGEARRLYLAIDGRKSVAELASITHLNTKEIDTALSILLAQKLIQVCDQIGQPIDGSWFLDNP